MTKLLSNQTQMIDARPESPGKEAQNGEVKLIVEDGVLKVKDLPQVMKEFQKPIAADGLQSTLGTETQKGYDTLGYGYAWISERLNTVVGFCWRIEKTNETIKETKSARGNDMYEVQTDVVLQLGNWKNFEKTIIKNVDNATEKVEEYVRQFEVLAESPIGHGWHKALSIADARKGSLTNGFKKAAGYLGIGNDAYKKAIDEENTEIKEALGKKKAKKKPATTTAPASNGNIQIIKQKLAAMGAKTNEEACKLLLDRFEFRTDSIEKLNVQQQKMVLARILQFNHNGNVQN